MTHSVMKCDSRSIVQRTYWKEINVCKSTYDQTFMNGLQLNFMEGSRVVKGTTVKFW